MEKNNEIVRSFASFGGGDFITVLNNKVIGEVQEFKYYENFKPEEGQSRFVGTIQVVIFDRETFREQIKEGINQFDLFAKNEYGNHAAVITENLEFTHRAGGVSIDQIIMQEVYHFKADKVSIVNKPFEQVPTEYGYTYRFIEGETDGTQEQ